MSAEFDQWLWKDPSDADPNLKDRLRNGAVLVAEDISYFVEHYNLLINQTDFQEGRKVGAKLKGASYTMTPHPDDAWTFTTQDGKVLEVALNKFRDSEGEYYLVPKNSLVFIRLRQELRIPYYMIGRHNLKIRYVYKGLLLGTGPQVDPGYVGRLYIPLHNFTTDDVKVHIEDSFVSIDFVRTTPLFRPGQEMPASLKDFYAKYGEAKSLLDPSKVLERTKLPKYLEGAKPRSELKELEIEFHSLKGIIDKAKEDVANATKDVENGLQTAIKDAATQQKDFEKELTTKWDTARNRMYLGLNLGAIALIGLMVVLLNYFRVDEGRIEKRFWDLQSEVALTNRADFVSTLQSVQSANGAFIQNASNQVAYTMLQVSNSESLIRSNLASVELRLQMLQSNSPPTLDRSKQSATNIVGHQ